MKKYGSFKMHFKDSMCPDPMPPVQHCPIQACMFRGLWKTLKDDLKVLDSEYNKLSEQLAKGERDDHSKEQLCLHIVFYVDVSAFLTLKYCLMFMTDRKTFQSINRNIYHRREYISCIYSQYPRWSAESEKILKLSTFTCLAGLKLLVIKNYQFTIANDSFSKSRLFQWNPFLHQVHQSGRDRSQDSVRAPRSIASQ